MEKPSCREATEKLKELSNQLSLGRDLRFSFHLSFRRIDGSLIRFDNNAVVLQSTAVLESNETEMQEIESKLKELEANLQRLSRLKK